MRLLWSISRPCCKCNRRQPTSGGRFRSTRSWRRKTKVNNSVAPPSICRTTAWTPFAASSSAGREERLAQCVAEVVRELALAHQQGRDVNLNRLKTRISSKYGLDTSPRLVDIIAAVPTDLKKALLPRLRAKPVRTASGVSESIITFYTIHRGKNQWCRCLQIAVVAVMCKPHRCPHINMTGNVCVYCPGGPDSDFEYSTQSYTGYEPTSMRAIRARYNPYLQTKHRVDQVRRYSSL